MNCSQTIVFVSLSAIGLAACGGGGGDSAPPPTPTVVFGGPQLSPTGGANGQNMVVADVDGDGLPDFAIANETLNSVSLLRGAVGGTFGSGMSQPAPDLVGVTALADVTGDRIVDLVAASGASATALVAPGVGDGTFAAVMPITVPWAIGALAAVDWNRDGLADLVLASAESPAVALLPGLGGGAFAAPVLMPTAFIVTDFAVAQFSGDQLPDLAIVGVGEARIDVLRNDGAAGFLPAVTTMTTGRGGQLVCCDLDRDRQADLIVLDADLVSVTAYLGTGNAEFLAGSSIGLAAANVDGLAAGDVDGDGETDLVAAAGNTIVAAYGDGFGGLSAAEVLRQEGGTVRSVLLSDTRGRGILDVVYVLAGSQLAVLHNPRDSVPGLARFGTGSPDCGGSIGMFATGVPAVGNADFGYVTTNAPVDALGMFMQGGPENVLGHDPFAAGFLMHLNFDLIVTRLVFSDPLGTSFIADPIPAQPGLVGLPVHVQTLWLADAALTCSASPGNVVSSRGLTATIQP